MTDRSRWIVDKTEVISDEAVVATMHPLASEAGAEMLRQGGNAVDAAVAAAFAVGVVEPHMSGLGGIAQLVFAEGKTGRSWVVDGTSVLPRATRPDMYALLPPGTAGGLYGWRGVVDDANTTGYRSPAVPGMPAAMCAALERFGRLRLEQVTEPAIRYAEQGFPIDWSLALYLAGEQARLARFPETRRAFYQPDGTCPRPPLFNVAGDLLRQPDLARSLRLIAERGPDALYRGEIGQRIADDMAEHGGLITLEDLADYRVRVWDPGLIGSYRGFATVQAPENTGAPTVLQMLNILEGYNLRSLGPGRTETLHLIAEAQRRAFVDRFAHLGDPAFHAVPYDGIVSRRYAEARRADIDPGRATPRAEPGDPWSYQERAPVGAAGAAGSIAPDGTCTTSLSVVDRDGNMVALTSTLGTAFGCGVVAAGTGIVLNAGATWFDPEPGSVNSVAPGKRILWAGTPTVVLREGRPWFACGAPGGRRILSAVLQSVLNVIDFGMGPQAAVTAPRVHCEGPETLVDGRFEAEAIEGLARLGHQITVATEHFGTSHFARPSMVLIDGQGRRRGGVSTFSEATALGL